MQLGHTYTNSEHHPIYIKSDDIQLRFVHIIQTGHYVSSRTHHGMQISNAKTNLKKSEWESLANINLDKNKIQTVKKYSSVCDIWKDNVHKLITKMEYQTPIYLQAFSQMHAEFLHSIDNSFGTCYNWQKQYFDMVGFEQKVINAYEKLCDSGTNNIFELMDTYANYKKIQSDLITDYMKIGNNYLCWWTDMCSKTMSFWNSQLNR